LRVIDTAEVARIARLVCDGTEEERRASLMLLLHLWRAKDQRITAEPNARLWCAALRETVSREYPRMPLGPPAMQGLIEIDRRSAEDFLVEQLDIRRLDAHEAERVAGHLGVLGTARSLARLVAMEQHGGELGAHARKTLERIGLVERGRIKALGDEWQRRKNSETLKAVYHLYVCHLPEGTPAEEVIEMLGEPDRRSPGAMWYQAEGRSLYLEIDDKGGIAGRGLD